MNPKHEADSIKAKNVVDMAITFTGNSGDSICNWQKFRREIPGTVYVIDKHLEIPGTVYVIDKHLVSDIVHTWHALHE